MSGVCTADSWELVYPPLPSPCSVVVVVGEGSSILGESIQHCLLHTGTTVQVIRVEDLQTVAHCQLVVAAQLDVDTAVRINTMARDSLTPFLYCKMVSGSCAVFYDQGEQSGDGSGGGHLRDDGLSVHVGAIIRGDKEEDSIISCDRAHYLEVGDSLMIGKGKMMVMEVMSDKEVNVSHGGVECKQGDLVLPLPSTGVPMPVHRPLSSSLPDQNSLPDPGLPAMLSSAGLVAAFIMDAVTKRFPLDNTLQLHSIPSNSMESIKQMEDKSVLVFGCGELSIQLIKSLVLLRVNRVTVICLVEEQARQVRKLNDSTGRNSTKIVSELIDPSKQDSSSIQLLWSQADFVLCAGGSTEERLLLHSWGVQFTRPGLDMAVEGRMGHIEAIVPHLTASYSCTPSPTDQEPPYCVIKSFPHLPEHAAAWAKHKITNLLHDKPKTCQQFLADQKKSPSCLPASQDSAPPGSAVSYKLLSMFGQNPTWEKCLQIARTKFDKYFSAKAMQLQSNFSADSTVRSGDLFWSWPKLFPRPLVFSPANADHVEFVKLLAVGLARVVGVQEGKEDGEEIIKILEGVTVPPFVPRNKEIITDESIAGSDATAGPGDIDLAKLSSLLSPALQVCVPDLPLSLTTRLSVVTTHLRCDLYNIPRDTHQQVMYAMGHLESCLSSTVHQVVGLGLSEMIKICSSSSRSPINWWVGPGLVAAAEAVMPAVTKLSPGLAVTIWDKLEIQGDSFTTLEHFLDMMKKKYQLEVTMVVQDSRMVFVPIMPGHKKRLPKLMSSLVKNPDSQGAVTLSVTAAADEDEEDLTVPPVRYFLG